MVSPTILMCGALVSATTVCAMTSWIPEYEDSDSRATSSCVFQTGLPSAPTLAKPMRIAFDAATGFFMSRGRRTMDGRSARFILSVSRRLARTSSRRVAFRTGLASFRSGNRTLSTGFTPRFPILLAILLSDPADWRMSALSSRPLVTPSNPLRRASGLLPAIRRDRYSAPSSSDTTCAFSAIDPSADH